MCTGCDWWRSLCRGHAVKTCVVVRHLSPDDEIVVSDGGAHGDCDDNEIAKRPYLKLKVMWRVLTL